MIVTRAIERTDWLAMKGFTPPGIRMAWVAVKDKQPIAVAGIMRDRSYVGTFLEDEGRWIAFYEAFEPLPKDVALHVILNLGRGLREMQEVVWLQCHDDYPTAEKFCKILGFTPTDEFCLDYRDGKTKRRMWKWQALAQS